MTVGRNDPCPCGSGKKYKKCCALQDQQDSSLAYQKGRQLQVEQNRSLLASRWYQTHWAHHRAQVNRLLATPSRHRNALLIGPGNCNDFDLAELVQRFDHIDMVDIDSDAVHSALTRIPSQDIHKVSVINFDITGLYDKIMPEFIAQLPSLTSEEAGLRLNELCGQLTPPPLPYELIEQKYDAIAVLAVFSQLFMPFYEENIAIHFPSDDKKLRTAAVKLADRLSELCFSAIQPLLYEDAQLIFYSDLLQFSALTPQLLDQLSDVNTALGPDFYRHRIAGSDGFLNYVDKHFNHMTHSGQMETWIWEFDQQRKYYTMGIALKYHT